MSHYEKLKAMKTGFSDDFRTAIYAQSISSKDYERYISGELPLILSDSVGKPLVSWSITGNTVQDGEPSPDNPVEIKGTGDKTGNLFDINTVLRDTRIAWSNGAPYKDLASEYSDYSDFIKVIPNTSYISSVLLFAVCFNANKEYLGALTDDGTYIKGQPNLYKEFTTLSDTEFIRLCTYVSYRHNQPFPDNTMLNEGSDLLPYEPYGYKVTEVTRGKNLFDGEMEQGGYYDADGTPVNLLTRIRNKNPIRIMPNLKYTISNEKFLIRHISFYDNKLNFISSLSTPTNTYTITTPNNAHYFKFALRKIDESNITPADLDWLQIESGDTATEYSPYIEPKTSTIYLSSPLMADEVLKSDGIRGVERGKLVLTENSAFERQGYSYDNSTKVMVAIHSIPLSSIASGYEQVLCTHFIRTSRAQVSFAPDNSFGQNPTAEYRNYFYFNPSRELLGISEDERDATVILNAWKNFLKSEYDKGTPVTIYYPLATPTSETVSVPQIPTLKGTTVLDVDTEVQPTNMSVTYKSRR